jgi:outer membrane murein-binding lipoprotein Lpp
MKTRLNRLATAGVATILLAGCVSSKKYKSSQEALQQMRNDSVRLAQQVTSLNENIQTLEQKNTSLQRSLDSSNSNYASQQKSLDYYQEYFNKQKGTLSQVSEELKGALSQAGLANEDVQQTNDAIYVSLDENKVFKKNSTAVTPNGKQALTSLAQVIKNRSSDVNVTVSDGDSSSGQSSTTAATADNMPADNMSANPAPSHHRTHQGMTHRRSAAKKAAADNQGNAADKDQAQNNASKAAGQSVAETDKKSNVAVAHKKAKRRYASSEGSMTFYNNPSRLSKNRAWALKQGRVNSVANGLLQNGVPKVNLLMQQPVSGGNAQSNSIKVIITPTMNDFDPQKNASAKGN